MTDVADWGLFYAAAGLRVFPVKPGVKRPSFSGWQADATTKPDLIHQYFREGTDRNIGIVMGERCDAWDIEAEHLARFSEWLYRDKRALPEMPIASTGGGGVHLLTQPTGVDGTRRLYLDGVHIGELKSRGGFILACPSETEGQYVWVSMTPGMALPKAPDWLLGLVKRPETPRTMKPWRNVSLAPQSDLEPLLRAVRQTPEGDRNANLHWAANRACDDGVPYELALAQMLPAYMELITPGETPFEREHEGRATIASAYRR